jgi:hypothetical protein
MNDYGVVDGSSEFVGGTGRPGFFELYFKFRELAGVIPEFQSAAQFDPDFRRGFAEIGWDQFCCCDDRIALGFHVHARFPGEVPDSICQATRSGLDFAFWPAKR